MGKKYLIDSNIAIYILNGNIPEKPLKKIAQFLAEECNLSIITKIEVLGWQFPTTDDQKKAEEFISASNVHQLNAEIADLTIDIRRGNNIKLPDAIIAATSISGDYTLLTRNVDDFSKISNLVYINPFAQT